MRLGMYIWGERSFSPWGNVFWNNLYYYKYEYLVLFVMLCYVERTNSPFSVVWHIVFQ